MVKNYKFIEQMIKMATSDFQLDLCKVASELFWEKYKKDVRSHAKYENLLGYILQKYGQPC